MTVTLWYRKHTTPVTHRDVAAVSIEGAFYCLHKKIEGYTVVTRVHSDNLIQTQEED